MMNKSQALAYGKKIGCKFYVKNSNGGLMGSFKTLKAAENCKAKFEKEYKNNPWNKGMKFYIEVK